MRHHSILLLGGSGFIGTHIAARLAASGRHVIVPTRRYNRARHLQVLPTVQVMVADIFDPAVLDRLLPRVDCVINLLGVLTRARRGHGVLHSSMRMSLCRACWRRYVHGMALSECCTCRRSVQLSMDHRCTPARKLRASAFCLMRKTCRSLRFVPRWCLGQKTVF